MLIQTSNAEVEWQTKMVEKYETEMDENNNYDTAMTERDFA
jgi:hypothetical protein